MTDIQVFAYYNVKATYPEPSNISFVLLKFEATQKANEGLIPGDNFSKLNYILARLTKDPSGLAFNMGNGRPWETNVKTIRKY